jgi:hypothetical protein
MARAPPRRYYAVWGSTSAILLPARAGEAHGAKAFDRYVKVPIPNTAAAAACDCAKPLVSFILCVAEVTLYKEITTEGSRTSPFALPSGRSIIFLSNSVKARP